MGSFVGFSRVTGGAVLVSPLNLRAGCSHDTYREVSLSEQSTQEFSVD